LCLFPKVAFERHSQPRHLPLLLGKKRKTSLPEKAWRAVDAVYLAIKFGSLHDLQDLPRINAH